MGSRFETHRRTVRPKEFTVHRNVEPTNGSFLFENGRYLGLTTVGSGPSKGTVVGGRESLLHPEFRWCDNRGFDPEVREVASQGSRKRTNNRLVSRRVDLSDYGDILLPLHHVLLGTDTTIHNVICGLGAYPYDPVGSIARGRIDTVSLSSNPLERTNWSDDYR